MRYIDSLYYMYANQSNPRVSIIIPVYNTREYLAATLDSVLAQTYGDFELIMVNDGSTDGSQSVIDSYCVRDKRIVAITTKNQGPSKARMEGLAIAKGEYVQFLDSDDTLVPDAIEQLVGVADASGADMVIPKFWFKQADGRRTESYGLVAPEVTGREYLREILSGRGYWCVWVLTRRTLYDGIKDWATDMLLGEDVIWKTQLVLAANKIAGVDRPLIEYNDRSGSLSHVEVRDERKYSDFKKYIAWLKDVISANGLDDYMDKALAIFHVNNVCQQLSWRFFEGVEEELIAICRDMERYPDIINGVRSRYRKLIKAFCKSRWYGRCKLKLYIAVGKL